eukprot:272509-Chlamydomonas_euryale.AAC.1
MHVAQKQRRLPVLNIPSHPQVHVVHALCSSLHALLLPLFCRQPRAHGHAVNNNMNPPPSLSTPQTHAANTPAAPRCPPTAVGVASPSAHGHAVTSTLHAICADKMSDCAADTAAGAAAAAAAAAGAASTCGNRRVPASAQNANVAADNPMTPYAKRPATASAMRWMGAVRACASSTMRTISAMTVAWPLCSARTVTAPSQLSVPAMTLLPS